MSAKKRPDPYASFNFIVELDGVVVAGFSECAGLTSESEVVEYRDGSDPTRVRKIPGLVKYPTITLKRGATRDKSLWQWREKIVQGVDDRRAVLVRLVDRTRADVFRWRANSAWPRKISGPALNAKGNDIAIEALELEHERLELDP